MNNIDQLELVTIELLQKDALELQIGVTIELIETTTTVQVINILNLLQVMYRSNALVSALGTNTDMFVIYENPYISSTFYWTGYGDNRNKFDQSCMDKNLIAQAGFYDERMNGTFYSRTFWPHSPYDEYERTVYVMIDGFFGACFPLDAILASSLDCLYSFTCLEIFPTYFPKMNSVRF